MTNIYEAYPGFTKTHSIHQVAYLLGVIYKGAVNWPDPNYDKARINLARRIAGRLKDKKARADKVPNTHQAWRKDHPDIRYDGQNIYIATRDIYAAATCISGPNDCITKPIGQKGFSIDYYHRHPQQKRYSHTYNQLADIDKVQKDIKMRQYWEEEYVAVYVPVKTLRMAPRYEEVTF